MLTNFTNRITRRRGNVMFITVPLGVILLRSWGIVPWATDILHSDYFWRCGGVFTGHDSWYCDWVYIRSFPYSQVAGPRVNYKDLRTSSGHDQNVAILRKIKPTVGPAFLLRPQHYCSYAMRSSPKESEILISGRWN